MRQEQNQREKTCCFTGHRPKSFPWPCKVGQPQFMELLQQLDAAIDTMIAKGCTTFICGNAQGVDTWAAELVLNKKRNNPDVRLEIALPFDGHNDNLPEPAWSAMKRIHSKADRIYVTSWEKIAARAFHLRNRYMVDHSGFLIAVFVDREPPKGGTYATLQYAKEQGLEVLQIQWLNFSEGGRKHDP